MQSIWKPPNDLRLWTQQDVEVFLNTEAFDILLAYFELSGGQHLFTTYRKCLKKPDEMLRVFQEVVDGQDKFNEGTFKMLLDRLEQYAPRSASSMSTVPPSTTDNTVVPPKSSTCTIM
jgi:hypothetical protein